MPENKVTLSLIVLAVTISISCGNQKESLEEVRSIPGELVEPVREIAGANSQFALDLYNHLRLEEGNLFFSPLGITTAIAQVWIGAKGDTRLEMARALHFSESATLVHRSYGAIITSLNSRKALGLYDLALINRLWLDSSATIKKSFLEISRDHYKSAPERIGFSANPESARELINRRILDDVRGKIKDLIPPKALDTETRFVITNSIYFKGDWQRPFSKAASKARPYYPAPGDTIQVPTMYQEGEFRLAQNDTCSLITLPYDGNDLIMIIVLPQKVDGLGEIETNLNKGTLNRWLGNQVNSKVRVSLPLFKMNSSYHLNQYLRELGIESAFDQEKADFTGMTDVKPLWISSVFHKGFISVNEEGTEAAAGTGVVLKSIGEIEASPPVFRADHPFLFLIQDRITKCVLFMGRVVNPLAG